MIETVEQAKELAEKFNTLTSDMEKIKFIYEHKKTIGIIFDDKISMPSFLINKELFEEDKGLLEFVEKINDIELNPFEEHFDNEASVILLTAFDIMTDNI